MTVNVPKDCIPFNFIQTPNNTEPVEFDALYPGQFNVTVPPVANRVAWICGFNISVLGTDTPAVCVVSITNMTTGNPLGPFNDDELSGAHLLQFPMVSPQGIFADSKSYSFDFGMPIRAYNPAKPVLWGTQNGGLSGGFGWGSYPGGMIYGYYAPFNPVPTMAPVSYPFLTVGDPQYGDIPPLNSN